ncbi:MAG: pyridoxamine 5'-phosphate oxidase family protein [Segetibacter sp.]
MMGELNYAEIEEVLQDQLVGRIGCYSDGVTYIVPVNYAYNDPYVYIHSLEGKR